MMTSGPSKNNGCMEIGFSKWYLEIQNKFLIFLYNMVFFISSATIHDILNLTNILMHFISLETRFTYEWIM